MELLKKIINDYMESRRDVRELSSVMSKTEAIEVMRDYNLMLGGADE